MTDDVYILIMYHRRKYQNATYTSTTMTRGGLKIEEKREKERERERLIGCLKGQQKKKRQR